METITMELHRDIIEIMYGLYYTGIMEKEMETAIAESL